VSPIKPVVPVVTPVTLPTTAGAPPPPGNIPLKPAASVPASLPEGNAKTGTSVVKSAPPKETARITVKPNLPGAPARPAGNFPVAKVAAGAVPVVAAGGAVAAKVSKPATTIVKSGVTTPRASVVKSSPSPASAAPSTQFQEEGSTTLTTVLAGVLAGLTWGTAGVLLASYFALI
jgi:hypothetical protein